ncbi:MAG: hypothetical protein AAFP03_07485 [Cyanobacteria bacterium J06598_3]
MTEHPKTSPTDKTASSQEAFYSSSPLRRFCWGTLAGALPVFVAVDASAYLTHTPLLELGLAKLAIAALIPLICGGLSVAYKGKIITPLMDALGSIQM